MRIRVDFKVNPPAMPRIRHLALAQFMANG
jgi:hypothetical protein